MSPILLRIAIPSPLRRTFDYLPPTNAPLPPVGARVRVRFGRRQVIGVVTGTGSDTEVPAERLRAVDEVLDGDSLFPADLLRLLERATEYYRHPPGEVYSTALPALLRQGGEPRAPERQVYRLTGAAPDPETVRRRAPRQAELLARLAEQPHGTGEGELAADAGDWRAPMGRLVERGWVEVSRERPAAEQAAGQAGPELNAHQAAAVTAVTAAEGFSPFVLHGVTGSGKTEVYLRICEAAIGRGQQVLILVPEIGLTPQLVGRFRRRLGGPLAVLHSGLNDTERLHAWELARRGEAAVVIGTRSAVFTPLARPGAIIVDEEHDTSYKQQEGFRYSARDLAIMRAQLAGCPVVLGSATPSFESLHNAQQRFTLLRLPERAGTASHPRLRLVDLRAQPLTEGMSPTLLKTMEDHLARGSQVLLFLNRRGYSPTLLCHDCGWVSKCLRCDAHMTLYAGDKRLRCHHCGAERPVEHHCPDCGSTDLQPVGQGTERVEAALGTRFPGTEVIRVDRDTTRRKGSLDALLARVGEGRPSILLGTQMLAKGHHFPDVTLVGILDADRGLFSADFRAGERMAQLIIQVAGRAGRAEKPGEVLIQTHQPDHALLQHLIREGYDGFAAEAMTERRLAELPPYTHLALLRAEAVEREAPLAFLEAARALAAPHAGTVLLLGPIPAPMERRAGRFRAQLLLQASERAALQRLLSGWAPQLETLRAGQRVRWSLDVDPAEMF